MEVNAFVEGAQFMAVSTATDRCPADQSIAGCAHMTIANARAQIVIPGPAHLDQITLTKRSLGRRDDSRCSRALRSSNQQPPDFTFRLPSGHRDKRTRSPGSLVESVHLRPKAEVEAERPALVLTPACHAASSPLRRSRQPSPKGRSPSNRDHSQSRHPNETRHALHNRQQGGAHRSAKKEDRQRAALAI